MDTMQSLYESVQFPCVTEGCMSVSFWGGQFSIRSACWTNPSPSCSHTITRFYAKGQARQTSKQNGGRNKQCSPFHQEPAATLSEVKTRNDTAVQMQSSIKTYLSVRPDLQTESQLSAILTLLTCSLPLKHLSAFLSLRNKLHFPNTGSALQCEVNSSIK